MAFAYIQEFDIQGGDTSTSNYDAVVAAMDIQAPIDGLIVHPAGFDMAARVFRILDVWESREQADRFLEERLGPALQSVMAGAAEELASPRLESWYELHDTMRGR